VALKHQLQEKNELTKEIKIEGERLKMEKGKLLEENI
jgi:hypothetical protein